jgi:hypothetical protein
MSESSLSIPEDWMQYSPLAPQSDEARAVVLYDHGQPQEAAELLRSPAERGERNAQFGLGNIYATAEPPQRDFHLAKYWWTLAAAQRHSQAEFNLGVLYETEDAGEQCPEKAAEWYARAAEGGHHKAMSKLAEMYTNGIGVPRDNVSAYFWKRRSCAPAAPDLEPGLAAAVRPVRGTARKARAKLWTKPASKKGEWPPDARGEGLLYLLHNTLAFSLHNQRSIPHPEDSPDSLGSVWSFAEVTYVLSSITSRTPNVAGFLFQSDEAPSNAPEALHVPTEEFWLLARPGDQVLLTDRISHHVTQIFAVDRKKNMIGFADAWPDRFLLCDGFNAAGVSATSSSLEEDPAKVILWTTRDEYLKVARGLFTIDTPAYADGYLELRPELKQQPRALLALGASLLRWTHPEEWHHSLPYLHRAFDLIDPGADASLFATVSAFLFYGHEVASYVVGAPQSAAALEATSALFRCVSGHRQAQGRLGTRTSVSAAVARAGLATRDAQE